MKKILIIGAGISGLAAANHLMQQGFAVKILEARSRVGGRISVDHALGMPLGRGAHWIHGGAENPMMQLVQRYASPMVRYSSNKLYLYTHQGQLVPPDIISSVLREFDEALDKAKQYALHAPRDCALSSALEKFWPTHIADPSQAAVADLKIKFFENYMGGGYENLSARNWDICELQSHENWIVLDGFSAVIDGLSKNCDIAFNTCVQAIHYGGAKVEVITKAQTYVADKVIITLPLGVLKANAVQFYPALPPQKQAAIRAIGMGLFDIIRLEFPAAFWPQDCASFFIAAKQGTLTSRIFVNLSPFLQRPILYSYVGGATGKAFEKLPAEKILTSVMQTLRGTFGANVPDPVFFDMTHWDADPFSYGSYSYTAVGATREHYVELGEPVADRLYFAGEATNAHLYDATTHGAYLSGIREAERIIAS